MDINFYHNQLIFNNISIKKNLFLPKIFRKFVKLKLWN